ncbi:hypothetical protein JTZ10_16255 [Gordonia rubripertincta]|uniref:Transposase n=1 Tax=Gordonia rubripertincta TaxID=36822 RepID=A0AAW4G7M7_GORRU|nr:hypothetical protein [Gordonia rubripertincta]MBM7279303.1 hypothetical protein [Gordonia rubripertincta]
MPAAMLNTPTIVSSRSGSIPPIRLSRSSFSDGERIVIRQAGAFVTIPDADLARLLTALKEV